MSAGCQIGGAIVVDSARIPWYSPPGHPGAYSKILVGPGAPAESDAIDFRVSLYPPGGEVTPHVHEKAWHIYYFISGEALMLLGEEEIVARAGQAVFIPAGVVHGAKNTSTEDLHFVVLAVPPDIPR
ncbi:MAG: cupin domain-containing protein [Gammaproteobacteria bacterium]